MRHPIQHPARLVPLAFLIAILIGTVLLMLPASRSGPDSAPFLTALFTATSAVCVTGLIVQDTPTYWSAFGQGVILALFQVGGLGIMTGATLLGLLVTRRLKLSSRLVAQAETKSLSLGDVTGILRLIVIVTVTVELLTAAVLALRLRLVYDNAWGEAAWHGLFQAVSAFNNAGFSTYSDSLSGFALDPAMLIPIMAAVVIGGLGFPVLFELRQGIRKPARWSVHTKITLLGTAFLLALGLAATAAYEWTNPATLGAFDWPGKLMNAASHSVMARTAGFNSIDVGSMRIETLAVTYALMLIGGGSAGTAGGIKVTTFFLLGFVVWAEIRGRNDTTAFNRRIGTHVQRQALTVVLLAAGMVSAGVLILLSVTSFPLQDVVFEVVSAFATVGLSTGITADLPTSGQLTIIVLMFVGRVGTITLASALALQERYVPYRYPEERPIVG
ncbi:TrkH family potassium uptake protein [Nitratireductor sp. ZSWI3]|uniref:TrkH family potassium uptake protein n=1 Tax=Nitratireductor sp. ZSWI3 TaxID=2966359 RepID=UPI00214FA293|nr:potassium transporter TrkG [Nitratireductor sp. ZSWI3]MCR4264884.1 TrkH family potassium uptake protein [Nitratireductor sp. ZSWI3]